MATEAHIYGNGIATGRKEAAAEIENLRALLGEVIGDDNTYVGLEGAKRGLELFSRLAQSGWFKRASAALNSPEPPKG